MRPPKRLEAPACRTGPSSSERRVGHFAYQPALDGIRAVAVAVVLLFHAGFGWMTGGYVGVSVFFTLSGFLITTLALVEHERRGALDVGAFYARRLRRLLPASLLCLGAVVVAAAIGLFDGATELRRDVLGALTQVYNWVAIAGGGSYADATAGGAARTSPLEHYWSLAIEEQFYWVWPLVLLVVLRGGRRARRLALGGLFIGCALIAPLTSIVWGPDAAYWATPARLAEILAGAVAALVLHDRRRIGRRLPQGTALAAPAGLLVILWAALTWPAGDGPAYDGWLPVFALASVALIVGVQVDGPLRRLLSRAPFVALGIISYGVYLYHWPIYALLDEARTGLDQVPLFALRVAVTLVVSAASYVFVERPVRQSGLTIRPAAQLATVGCALVAALVFLLPVNSTAFWAGSNDARLAVAIEPVASRDAGPIAVTDRPPGATSATTARATTVPPTTVSPTTVAATAVSSPTVPLTTTTSTLPPPPPPPPPSTLSRPARVLVIGDSTASATGEGLVAWAGAHPDLAQVTIRWGPACGFLRAGAEVNESAEFAAHCDDLWAAIPADVATLQPDVVLLMATAGDSADRVLADGTTVRPGEPAFDALIAAEYQRTVDELVAAGVRHVLWAIPPAPNSDGHLLAGHLTDAERWTTLRTAVEATAAANPDVVTAIDVAAWVDAHGPTARPDGLHLSREAAAVFADELLAPTVISLAVA